MARGRSTQIISMIKWIRTSRLSIKISLSLHQVLLSTGEGVEIPAGAFPEGIPAIVGVAPFEKGDLPVDYICKTPPGSSPLTPIWTFVGQGRLDTRYKIHKRPDAGY